MKAPGTTFLISSAFHTEWAAKIEKLTCAQITFDYIEFIPKILGSQEVPCFHVHNLASNSYSISNFLSNYLVTPVLLNHPAVEPLRHVEYMFSPPDNKLHLLLFSRKFAINNFFALTLISFVRTCLSWPAPEFGRANRRLWEAPKRNRMF